MQSADSFVDDAYCRDQGENTATLVQHQFRKETEKQYTLGQHNSFGMQDIEIEKNHDSMYEEFV